MRRLVLSMAIGLLVAVPAAAGDRCGAPACCNKTHECCRRCGLAKTCKVVREMKKVKKTVWAVECEEFCPSLPGCGRACKPCGGCGKASCESCCDPRASLRRPMVPPRCCKVRCRKKLVKKEITCEVPIYKCVVVCCNRGCCEAEGCGEAEAAAPAEATTRAAPLPPVMGTSYLKSLKTRYLPK